MGVQINGSEGYVIASKGTYSGNVTIGGTLTYEDVTNIDSVGLVTARTGIEIGARPGVAASISIDGNMVVSGITTIGGNSNGGNEKLNVHGAIRSSSSSVNFGAGLEGTILDYDTANDVARFGHVNGASGSARDVVFLNGGVEKVRIKSDGNVGIGTDNPAQALHVNRSSGDTYLRLQGGTNQGTLIHKTDGTLIGGFVSGGGVGGSVSDIAVRVETGNNIVFAHGTTERLRVDSGGNLSVGVNTNGGGNRLYVVDNFTDSFVNPSDSILRIENANTSGTTGQASISFTSKTSGSNADSAIVSQADDASGNSRLEFWTDTSNGMTEKLSIRGSDGRVTVTNDIEFSTSGTGGLFGKFAVTNQAYTANANLDIALTTGNYIFSVRSGGVYHYNAVFVVTYYDSADKNSVELLHGDYGTTATHTVIHNSNNNGTFRLTFNRNFDGINVRQLKLS